MTIRLFVEETSFFKFSNLYLIELIIADTKGILPKILLFCNIYIFDAKCGYLDLNTLLVVLVANKSKKRQRRSLDLSFFLMPSLLYLDTLRMLSDWSFPVSNTF
ncbi:MAG: hypothetical protein CMI58_04675 [Parcubacteria group bacterium]|jgi:hypothetical protein|nr:hypothetical protein [Parcubacteria group bacterium]|tara:strand:- start:241 stop:552 length:312 start_codon:yes stop_codon:yes gene_type:complete